MGLIETEGEASSAVFSCRRRGFRCLHKKWLKYKISKFIFKL